MYHDFLVSYSNGIRTPIVSSSYLTKIIVVERLHVTIFLSMIMFILSSQIFSKPYIYTGKMLCLSFIVWNWLIVAMFYQPGSILFFCEKCYVYIGRLVDGALTYSSINQNDLVHCNGVYEFLIDWNTWKKLEKLYHQYHPCMSCFSSRYFVRV